MKLNTKCVRIFADKHLENIRSMFKTLYEDEILTDCTLICKGGSVKAHKIILAACSPYFRKIFSDHVSEKAIFIMYGVTFDQLKVLIALIYKGCIDIPNEHLSSVFDLAEELDISGILVEGKDTNYSQHGKEDAIARQKLQGQKRLSIPNVSENESSASKIAKIATENVKLSSPPPKPVEEENVPKPTDSPGSDSTEPLSEVSSNEQYIGHPVDEQSSLSAWARKERKFQCNQCPSSFKRASHLTRHQLVHTGERPFPCNQCDKAFSRHDKLKNHIHKTHELELLNEALPPDSLYTIGHVQILTPEQTMVEMSGTVDTLGDADEYKPYFSGQEEDNDDEGDDDDEDSASNSNWTEFKPPLKRKHRGRPRKYPPKINLGPKRPRGRPRKFPITDPIPKVKRPRGRPRIRPLVSKIKRPVGRPRIRPLDFDDFDKKDMMMAQSENIPDNTHDMNTELDRPNIMEPLVQIKTEPNSIPEHQDVVEPDLQILPVAATEPEIQIIIDSGHVSTNATAPPPVPQNQVPPESSEKPVKPEHRSFFENIGLFENTVAKIGECTISVSNPSASSLLTTKNMEAK